MNETYSDPRVRLPKPGPHRYSEDVTLPPASSRQSRPCRCGVPEANAIHDPAKVAALTGEAHEAQAEARRRTGEQED